VANPKNLNIRKYYDGDHWDSWIGPKPSDPQREEDVKRVFVSLNLVKECVDRHARCLIGKFPNWYLKDASGERPPEGSEAEVQLQQWIERVFERAATADRLSTEEITNPFFEAVVSLLLDGRSHLRLWQPTRFADLDDDIERTHLHSIRDGGVTLDYSIVDGFLDEIRYACNGKLEVQKLDGKTLTIDNGETDENGQPKPYEVDTGGRWAITTLKAAPLVTRQITQLQDSLNFALTMMMRDQEQSGFLERLFINIQAPGEDVQQPDGSIRFVPEEMARGVGIDQFLSTVPDRDGKPVTGEVVMSQPIGPDHYLKTIERLIDAIYNQFGQGHMIGSGDGAINGVSRVQMRADFEQILQGHAHTIQAAFANVFNVVLRLLGYDQYTCVVELRPTTGKLMPDEIKAIIEEHNADLLDQAGAIVAIGRTDDPDTTIKLIEEDKARQSGTVPVPTPENTPPEESVLGGTDQNAGGVDNAA
jgi:hypothetical protein